MASSGTAAPLVGAVGLAAQDFLDLIKLEHVLAGIYIWEYFTTLDVEWQFYRGMKRSVVSTAWVYSLCKLSALTYTIINLIGLNVTSPTAISCEAWIVSRFVFATIAIMCASALAIIRISALWERNIFVVLTALGTSLAFAAFWLRQGVLAKNLATFVPELGCEYVASTNERPLAIAILCASVVYLVLMTGGLLKRGVFGQQHWWKAFYVQGVAWLLLASAFAIPGVVLLYVNSNGAWNQMLRGPEFLIIIIGATRLYSTLMTDGAFATFHVDSSLSSGGTRPTQLEAFKVRPPGNHTNSVTFEIHASGLQSRGVPGGEDYKQGESSQDISPTQSKTAQMDEESANEPSQTKLSTDPEALYVGQEK